MGVSVSKGKKSAFEVRMLPLSKIKRYTNNPRRNAHAVGGVVKSLNEFGWRQPIVVDRDYVIVVGDTRYLAAQLRGDTKVPVHVADDLTEDQARAYRIADNRVGEEAQWDDSKLLAEFASLRKAKFDLSETGFSAEQLERFSTKHGKETAKLTDFSILPTDPKEWIVIHGPMTQCAEVLAAIKSMKLAGLHVEYSADPEFIPVTKGA